MIIALPEKDHDHLADALVRDLGFTRVHVDAVFRDLLLKLDPKVGDGVEMANRGGSQRLSSKLEQLGGSWDRLLHPPRGSGAGPDRAAAEVQRQLDVLRSELDDDFGAWPQGDVVLVGITTNQKADYAIVGGGKIVAIAGRAPWDAPGDGPDRGCRQIDRVIAPAGVVGEQEAIVAYVKELREPKTTTVGELAEAGVKPQVIYDAVKRQEAFDVGSCDMSDEQYAAYLKTIVLGHTETLHGEPLGEALSAPETSLTAPEN